jgi:hypothetical protein
LELLVWVSVHKAIERHHVMQGPLALTGIMWTWLAGWQARAYPTVTLLPCRENQKMWNRIPPRKSATRSSAERSLAPALPRSYPACACGRWSPPCARPTWRSRSGTPGGPACRGLRRSRPATILGSPMHTLSMVSMQGLNPLHALVWDVYLEPCDQGRLAQRNSCRARRPSPCRSPHLSLPNAYLSGTRRPLPPIPCAGPSPASTTPVLAAYARQALQEGSGAGAGPTGGGGSGRPTVLGSDEVEPPRVIAERVGGLAAGKRRLIIACGCRAALRSASQDAVHPPAAAPPNFCV